MMPAAVAVQPPTLVDRSDAQSDGQSAVEALGGQARLDDYVSRVSNKHVIAASPFLSDSWSAHMLGGKPAAVVLQWFEDRGYSRDQREPIRQFFQSPRDYDRHALTRIVEREHASIRSAFFGAYAACRRELYDGFCHDHLHVLGPALDGRNRVGHIILDFLLGMT
jgi:hypothetical protein